MKKKNWRRLIWILLIIIIIGNIIAYNHAYRFTHFIDSKYQKTKRPEKLGFGEKIKTLFFGINVPKSTNKEFPSVQYETITINSYEKLEAWQITMPQQKGIVIMFHGYSGSKSSLLPYSSEFNQKNYSTMLVDFMGSGGSSGNSTTLGYKESRDVKEAFDFVKVEYPDKEIILFGTSMGAVSIMKAIEEYNINPDKIILECPFGNMLATTRARFKAMNIPSFALAELLVFYGGIQVGYNAFKHNPTEYAKKIDIPTLLLCGGKDDRVSKSEIDEIYKNLSGNKQLVIFKNSEHEIYLNNDKEDWNNAIDTFLE